MHAEKKSSGSSRSAKKCQAIRKQWKAAATFRADCYPICNLRSIRKTFGLLCAF
jgi:hypothetical protein